ncbi:hypothetical protein KEM48_002526, partial [Puccinia striiformis f. sp. tritici PST-130]
LISCVLVFVLSSTLSVLLIALSPHRPVLIIFCPCHHGSLSRCLGYSNHRSNPAPASQLGLIPIKNSTTQSSAHEATIAKLLKEVASLKASQSKSDRKKANTSIQRLLSAMLPLHPGRLQRRLQFPLLVPVTVLHPLFRLQKRKPQSKLNPRDLNEQRLPLLNSQTKKNRLSPRKRWPPSRSPPSAIPSKCKRTIFLLALHRPRLHYSRTSDTMGPSTQDSVPRPPNSAPSKNSIGVSGELNKSKRLSKNRTHFGAQSNSQFLSNVQGGRVRYESRSFISEATLKELKEEGKVAKDAAHKRFSKNRERLRDKRLDYAIVNKFPKRYRAILEPISAHSDDEKEEGNRFFTIKTLMFRSKNANRFFRRLDAVMLKASEQNPSAQGSRRRIRRLPRTPVMSTSLVAPKGLAIDYYGPKWYNELDLAQQKKIPNRSILAFLQRKRILTTQR